MRFLFILNHSICIGQYKLLHLRLQFYWYSHWFNTFFQKSNQLVHFICSVSNCNKLENSYNMRLFFILLFTLIFPLIFKRCDDICTFPQFPPPPFKQQLSVVSFFPTFQSTKLNGDETSAKADACTHKFTKNFEVCVMSKV